MDHDAYKQKIEAELTRVEAKILEMKAAAKSKTADARIEYAKQIEHLEEKVAATRARLSELGDSSEEGWASMKAGMESAWSSIAGSVKDAFAESEKKSKD